jgi:Tol biopolymer transport system component
VRTERLCGQFLLSGDGTLIYQEGPHHESSSFVWLDRKGNRQSVGLGLQDFVAFALSPDGRRLATPIRKEQHTDIWVYDLARPQTPTRITFGGVHNYVTWSSDGRYVVFGRFEADGTCTIRAKDLQSGAAVFTIYEHGSFAAPLSYHGPTQELLFNTTREESGLDLMRGFVDLAEGDGATLERIEAVGATRYGEHFAAISPNRKWIVVNSDETGRWELYLSSYPDMRNRVQISTRGGEEPIWTGDGAKVIYRWNDTWFEVNVTTEPALEVSMPRTVASGPYVNVPGYSWDMTADGERFLFLEGPMHDTPTTKLQVVTNFLTELERLLPAEPGE